MDVSASKFTLFIIAAVTLLIYFNFTSSPPSISSSSSASSFSSQVGLPQPDDIIAPSISIQTRRNSSKSSSSPSSPSSRPQLTLIVPTLDLHPSCEVASRFEALTRNFAKRPTLLRNIPSSHICFKHGGHNPGSSRRGLSSLSTQFLKDKVVRTALSDTLEWRFGFSAPLTAASIQEIDNVNGSPSASDDAFSSKKHQPRNQVPQSKITQFELSNVFVLSDESDGLIIFSPIVTQEDRVTTIPLSGVYSMISNNWPQTLTKSVQVFAVEEIPETILKKNRQLIVHVCRKNISKKNNNNNAEMSKFCMNQLREDSGRGGISVNSSSSSNSYYFEFGYWQPPTDFLSSYHVTVEVTLTMFHAVFRSRLFHYYYLQRQGPADERDESVSVSFWNVLVSNYRLLKKEGREKVLFTLPSSGRRSVVITAKPTKAMWGFKKKSCKYGAEVCLETVWAAMYVTLFSFLANAVAISPLSPSSSSSSMTTAAPSPLAMSSSGSERGKTVVLGMSNSDVPSSLRFFETLHGGYPTFCEPLWGPDPLLLHDDDDVVAADRTSASSTSSAPKNYKKAKRECDLLLWMARSILVEASLLEVGSSSLAQEDLSKAQVKILYATRRGDWARDVLNEDEMLKAIDEHVSKKYSRNDESLRAAKNSSNSPYEHVSVVKFAGRLQDQVIRVANSSSFTIFIAAHGANIIPSLFLPVNAGVITLDVFADGSNGFYPYGVFPSWLHWRRLGVDRVCNRKLEANAKSARKNSCKVRSPNNDDLTVNRIQIKKILQFVDEIVELQNSHKMKKRVPFREL